MVDVGLGIRILWRYPTNKGITETFKVQGVLGGIDRRTGEVWEAGDVIRCGEANKDSKKSKKKPSSQDLGHPSI